MQVVRRQPCADPAGSHLKRKEPVWKIIGQVIFCKEKPALDDSCHSSFERCKSTSSPMQTKFEKDSTSSMFMFVSSDI